MKTLLRRGLKNFLAQKGVYIARMSQTTFAKSYYETIQKNLFCIENDEILSVVFSKDRAMQLDAFLRSFFANVANPGPLKILYVTSSEDHYNSYEELKSIYSDKSVEFITEENFREQIIALLDNSVEDRILFFVDDMIFNRKIDFDSLRKVDPFKNIVALSRGKDLTYSTVLAKKIETPTFSKLGDDLFTFSWKDIQTFSDWTFPLGLSGYMYARKEIGCMLKTISFKAPNSMEGQMSNFIDYFLERNGVCSEYTVTPCVHANLTQTEGFNNITGHFTLEDLLQEWKNGKRIKFEDFNGTSVTEAETKKYEFTER